MPRLLAALLATACGSAVATSLTPPEIAQARKLYVAKCAKCHKFYEPKKYSENEWQRWMDSMSKKSKLKPSQSELLRQYLEEYRAGTIPSAR